jgi:hypothetical protein
MQYNPAFDMAKTGAEPENTKPDEFMITVPDLDHYTNDITFSTSKYYINNGNTSADFVNGITVVCKKSDVGTIVLDGVTPVASIPGAKQYDVTFPATMTEAPRDTYTVLYAPVTPGFHTVTSSSAAATFMVYVYGAAQSTSAGNTGYGYLAGFKFLSEADKPITDGPYFDFTDPIPNPGPVVPGPGPNNPNIPALTQGDYPMYDSIWEAKFYTLVPTKADLKTRNCSEAYYRFYMEERFNPMKVKLEKNILPSRCAAGLLVDMQHLVYYSQYTDGYIRLKVRILPAVGSSCTLNDIMVCTAEVAEYISQYVSWWPGYKNVTDFLKNDAHYLQGCDILHMKDPSFTSPYLGWMCPVRPDTVGSDARVVTASVVTLFALLLVQLVAIMEYLR